MKLSVVLLPFVVFSTVLMGTTVAGAQTYQPSNRVPVADGTLGTQVLGGNGNFGVVGGVSRGQNLFHSFQDFSVPTGGAVTFVNPVGTQSIITRVTGGVFSDVNGSINSQGANFFLINPNGVVFGPGVQLNVGRVFAASTANGIDMVDGAGRAITFGVNASDAPLLAINADVPFNVSRFNLGGGGGEIRNFGVLQTGNANQYIGLIGGNVTSNGGQINALGGRVELGGLSAPGIVEFGVEGNNPRLSFLGDVARSDVFLANNSGVYVAGVGGGDIAINARNIGVLTNSILTGGIFPGLGSIETIAGDIKLQATQDVILLANSSILNYVNLNSTGKGGNIKVTADRSVLLQNNANISALTLGTGSAGDVTINTNSLSLRDGAQISASTFGNGSGGSVVVTAKDSIRIDRSAVFSTVGAGGIGSGGDIVLNTTSGFLSLMNGSQLVTSVAGQSTTQLAGRGNSGNIIIDAASIALNDGAGISVVTSGEGSAGNVTLKAKDFISIVGKSNVFGTVESGGVGNGGNIDLIITSGSLSLQGGSQLLTSIRSTSLTQSGAVRVAGNVKIITTNGDTEIIDVGSGILSTTDRGAIGNAGNISIDTGFLSLRNGAQIQASTSGKGSAGNTIVRARNSIYLTNKAGIFSTVEAGGNGKGGDIDITSTNGSLSILDGSQLLTNVRSMFDPKLDILNLAPGEGDAGNVRISVVNGTVNIVGVKDGLISSIRSLSEPRTDGNAGSITINTDSFFLQNGAIVAASTFGKGNAGNVSITAKDSIFINGESTNAPSRLSVGSASATGSAGDIIITSPKIALGDGSTISSESISGNGGNINIGRMATNESTLLNDSHGNLSEANLLLLRRGAQISTNASGTPQQGGNGGNININSNLIVAIPGENSDITANAIRGRGGNVNINSQGLFGIQNRPQQTSNSDITASSDFGQTGNISINTPGIDPGKDKGELPTAPTDASNQISRACSPSQIDNKFYITGRGGHPANIDDQLTNDVVWRDPRSPKPATNNPKTQTTKNPIQPAVGLVFDGKGKATLIAANPEGETTKTRIACPTR